MCFSQLQSWARDGEGQEMHRGCLRSPGTNGEVVSGTCTMCPVLRLPCVGSQVGYVPKEGENHQVQNKNSSLNASGYFLQVNRDIVSGLKYVQHTYRTGVKGE